MTDTRGRGRVVSTCRVLPRNCSSEGEGRSGCELLGAARKWQKWGQGERLPRDDVRCKKTTKRKGTRGGVTRCLGLPNGGSEGVIAICRNLSGVTRFDGGGDAESCRYPPGNDRDKGIGSPELSGNGIFEGREWSWYELS